MSDITAWSVEPCGSEEKNLSSLINLEKYNHGESCFRHLNVVGFVAGPKVNVRGPWVMAVSGSMIGHSMARPI
jgi:hypothetical protein